MGLNSYDQSLQVVKKRPAFCDDWLPFLFPGEVSPTFGTWLENGTNFRSHSKVSFATRRSAKGVRRSHVAETSALKHKP